MIEELKAGRELDARVAVAKGHEVAWLDRVAKRFPDGEPMTLRCDRRRLQIVHRNPFSGRRYRSFALEYSTDIGAAWTLVEDLRRRGLTVTITLEPSFKIPTSSLGVVWCNVANGHGICLVEVWSATAPLAICKAFLAAVEGGMQ